MPKKKGWRGLSLLAEQRTAHAELSPLVPRRALPPRRNMPAKRRHDETTQMTLSRGGTLRAPAQQTLGFKRADVEPSDAADVEYPRRATGGPLSMADVVDTPAKSEVSLPDRMAHRQQLESVSNAVPEGAQVKEEPVAVKLEQVPAWPVGAWVKQEPAPAENTEKFESQQTRST